MDAAKLQDAMDYGTSNLGFAVRVYRRGCLVAEDRAGAGQAQRAVRELVDGQVGHRADVRPRDAAGADRPRGSRRLAGPEADRPHGWITMRDLLTMTSGLRWNGFRDYNIFTMPDRVQRRAHARHGAPARHVLRVRAEPGGAAGRGDRPRRRDGRRQVRPGPGDDPARDQGRHLELDPRPAPATSWASTA